MHKANLKIDGATSTRLHHDYKVAVFGKGDIRIWRPSWLPLGTTTTLAAAQEAIDRHQRGRRPDVGPLLGTGCDKTEWTWSVHSRAYTDEPMVSCPECSYVEDEVLLALDGGELPEDAFPSSPWHEGVNQEQAEDIHEGWGEPAYPMLATPNTIVHCPNDQGPWSCDKLWYIDGEGNPQEPSLEQLLFAAREAMMLMLMAGGEHEIERAQARTFIGPVIGASKALAPRPEIDWPRSPEVEARKAVRDEILGRLVEAMA